MKRKLVTTTLAASLVLGTVAGLSVGTTGKAYAATTLSGTNETQLLNTALSVYAQLKQVTVNGTKGTDLLHQARMDADNLFMSAVLKDGSTTGPSTVALANQLIPEIWSDITNAYGTKVSAYPTLQADLVTLIFHLSFVDSTDPVGELKGFKNNLQFTLTELANLTNDPAPSGEDVATFAAALQTRIMTSSLSGVSSYSSTTIQNNLDKVIADVKYVQDSMAASNNVTAKILKDADIEPQSIVSALQHFEKAIPSLVPARNALVQAFYAVLNPTVNNPGSGSGTGTGSGSGVGPGAGGAPAAPATTGDVKGPDLDGAKKDIDQVAAKLNDLFNNSANTNQQDALKKAQEAIAEAIRQAATVDLSTTVVVTGDVATPTIDVAKLEDVFKTVKAIAQEANAKLQEITKDAAPVKVVATLDLGKVDAKTTEIPIPADLLSKAKEQGIDAIAFKVNGISLTVDVDQLKSDTKLTVTKDDTKVATSVTSLPLASGVYEFNFAQSNGDKIENFIKPVEVRIPVTNTANVDTELLTLAKIVDGKLIFFGGSYNKDTGEFKAVRNSFSTYTIVENNISFSDTADVKDWAGRQIQVAAAKGILEGRGDQQFVPNGKVTRAEFAKMIVKAFGLEDATATESFSDVSSNDWFQSYVAAAVKAGIVNGRSDDKFAPNETITRAEMATMASRALVKVKGYKEAVDAQASLKSFADAADVNASLQAGVALAANLGVVIGEDGNMFNPNEDSTRAQAAVVVYRLLNK